MHRIPTPSTKALEIHDIDMEIHDKFMTFTRPLTEVASGPLITASVSGREIPPSEFVLIYILGYLSPIRDQCCHGRRQENSNEIERPISRQIRDPNDLK